MSNYRRTVTPPSPWSPTSWQSFPAQHQPSYSDAQGLTRALDRLAELPPIVFPSEVDHLTDQIALAAEGKQFILHGGDCVERFIDCNQQTITNKLKILLQMSVILAHAARRPVLRVGRIAGQFFKPRTTDYEDIDGRAVPTYKGDSVNGFALEERTPDPGRLVRGYFHATATLNYIRSMIDGGFADLHHPYSWNLLGMEQSAKWPDYQAIIDRILDAIHFMESFGGINRDSLGRIDFYTSHEGLHLGYESALTRRHQGDWYNLSAHLLWIGERTRQLDGAHLEYFRGIRNPVGVKLSAKADPAELRDLCRILNPTATPGKLVLISRCGASQVRSALPALIEGASASGVPVAWVCDPMHGNTRTTGSGRKTRDFADVLGELERTFEVHREAGSVLAGVHFELTGDDVTECTGGALELAEGDLEQNYESYCDPRLNYAQGLEMAFLISRFLR